MPVMCDTGHATGACPPLAPASRRHLAASGRPALWEEAAQPGRCALSLLPLLPGGQILLHATCTGEFCGYLSKVAAPLCGKRQHSLAGVPCLKEISCLDHEYSLQGTSSLPYQNKVLLSRLAVQLQRLQHYHVSSA
jgi:hypothetical protein